MNKPKVGDKFFLVDIGNRARFAAKQRYCEVTKVGRKYFTVTYSEWTQGGSEYKIEVEFIIETFRQRTEYSAGYALYESEQEWNDEIEKIKLARGIAQAFQYSNYKSLTLAQLREVGKILDIKIGGGEND